MNFASDNVTGASPEIAEAFLAANTGTATPYGDDETSQQVRRKIDTVFETEADTFLVATGTAANALSLAVLTPPYGSVYCHPEAHIQVDECGAPEFYCGGAKLVLLPDRNGKISAQDLKEALKYEDGFVHHVMPAAVSLTQTAETGVVYTLQEIRDICSVAHDHGLKVHMDGARFANAVSALGCSPADMTWKSGIDILSFGASKNGAFAAEAVVLFERGLDRTFAYRRKRAGHLFSKMRFLAAQFDAYLTDDLWLKLAGHANACMKNMASGLGGIDGIDIRFPPDANMMFAELDNGVIAALRADGFHFYDWPGDERSTIRLVTAFNTKMEDVDAFIASARKHAG